MSDKVFLTIMGSKEGLNCFSNLFIKLKIRYNYTMFGNIMNIEYSKTEFQNAVKLLTDREAFNQKEEVNLPQKDAGRKLSARLKKLGKQKPHKNCERD